MASKARVLRALTDLPVEVLSAVLMRLPLSAVVSISIASRTVHALTRCDRLWKHFYCRDLERATVPSYHRDHALYGRGFRLLYALAVSERTGRAIYMGAAKYVHVMVLCNGRKRRIGEWVVASDSAKFGQLVMDGYGVETCSARSKVSGKSTQPIKDSVYEGIWRCGEFVGPGRHASHDGTQRHSARFHNRGASGLGSLSFPGGDTYTGHLAGKTREGFGTYVWKSGDRIIGEWMKGSRTGRTVHYWRKRGVHSGQMVNSKFDGAGVQRRLDGTLKEGHWRGSDKTIDYAITRRGRASVSECPRQVERAAGLGAGDGTWYQVAIDGDLVWVSDSGGTRVQRRSSNDVLLGAPSCLALIAVSDDCPDEPRLAGRRIFGAAWPHTADSAAIDFVAIPDGIDSTHARLLALYLDSPGRCLLSEDAAKECARRLAFRAAESSVSLQWQSAKDDVDERALGLGMPFGRVLSTVAASGAGASPAVRCFITGRIVAATACDLLASGSLYERSALDAWFNHARTHCRRDPETGESLAAAHGWRLAWRGWMTQVSAGYLMRAVRSAASRCPDSPGRAVELLRHAVATATGALDARSSSLDPWALISAGIPLDIAADPSAPLLMGFDGLRLEHVEIRHSSWDPRGPWRLGPPDVLPDDPTLDDFELAGTDSDSHRSPTAFLESYGVVRINLRATSFMGAQLGDVYFFGQAFNGASFVGASLSRCVFVGCFFRDVAFANVVLAECHFYDCRIGEPGAHASEDTTETVILQRIRTIGYL